ncbi:MAG: hypothetical protein E7509_03155 [Ruminococcus sp.]|nr:hypothetical protein [Ruminococcus sp.]
MPVLIGEIKAHLKADRESVLRLALKRVPLPKDEIKRCEIYKTSLDARKRDNIHFVHTVYVELYDAQTEMNLCEKYSSLKYVENQTLEPQFGNVKPDGRIVVTGFGPAGMFCGLVLAEYGYKPVILERGDCVEKRTEKVNSFWNGDELDEETNVQFGEGGAGTFSDGKLTTRIKDPLCRYVLEKFCEFGAPEEILFKAKPHVGTDKLREVVKNIRERIISLGGEIRFLTRLDDLKITDGRVRTVVANNIEIKTSAVVLAVGHSARDTFEMLENKGVFMEPKPFSVGMRIEHKQRDVDFSLYGNHMDNPYLPKGEYQLSYRDKKGRACYTFCMCPGGYVVSSSSEKGGIVTNGMSEFARDGENANSAVVVSVSPEDFGKNPLDGVTFARKIEQNAFLKTNSYTSPAIKVGDFLGEVSSRFSVKPTCSRGVSYCGIDGVFPEFVTDMMKTGLRNFGNKMACFKDKGAVLTAPETRTSSPVKITRNEKGASLSVENLYPCGEGAGYAGGIMSSAVDGIKTALHIMEMYSNQ